MSFVNEEREMQTSVQNELHTNIESIWNLFNAISLALHELNLVWNGRHITWAENMFSAHYVDAAIVLLVWFIRNDLNK